MRYDKDMSWLITRGDLIGLEIEIVRSSQLNQQGLKGRVVDETLNTLVLEIPRRKEEIRIQKKTVNLVIRRPETGDKLEIDGRMLLNRPEERIKKHWRKIRIKWLKGEGERKVKTE